MKKLKFFSFSLIFTLGIVGALAFKPSGSPEVHHKTGYTYYYALSTDGNPDHYIWTTTQPGFPYGCYAEDNHSPCSLYVDNAYTPQANTPIPAQYEECPVCTHTSSVYEE